MPWQSPWQFPWQPPWQPSGQGLALSLQSLLGGTVTPQVLWPPKKKSAKGRTESRKSPKCRASIVLALWSQGQRLLPEYND